MKRPKRTDDEMHEEHEASLIRSGVRGKYAKRYHEGTNLALLAPDVAAACPDEGGQRRTSFVDVRRQDCVPDRMNRS